MLLVKTRVKPSKIHGLGCFAAERISRGSVIWVFDERIDVRIPLAKLAGLPPTAERFFLRYGYVEMRDGEKIVTLCGDHAKHMNHADQPNVIEAGDERQGNIAARDIEADEELTCNYYMFDLDAVRKLMGAFDAE
jgi:uncharacterized protein